MSLPFQIFFGPVPPSPVIDATVRKGHFKISATFSFLKGVHSLCPTRRPRQMQFRVTDCFSRRRCCCCVGLFYLSKLTYTFCTISMVRIFCFDCWTNKLFFAFAWYAQKTVGQLSWCAVSGERVKLFCWQNALMSHALRANCFCTLNNTVHLSSVFERLLNFLANIVSYHNLVLSLKDWAMTMGVNML